MRPAEGEVDRAPVSLRAPISLLPPRPHPPPQAQLPQLQAQLTPAPSAGASAAAPLDLTMANGGFVSPYARTGGLLTSSQTRPYVAPPAGATAAASIDLTMPMAASSLSNPNPRTSQGGGGFPLSLSQGGVGGVSPNTAAMQTQHTFVPHVQKPSAPALPLQPAAPKEDEFIRLAPSKRPPVRVEDFWTQPAAQTAASAAAVAAATPASSRVGSALTTSVPGGVVRPTGHMPAHFASQLRGGLHGAISRFDKLKGVKGSGHFQRDAKGV